MNELSNENIFDIWFNKKYEEVISSLGSKVITSEDVLFLILKKQALEIDLLTKEIQQMKKGPRCKTN